MSGRRISDAHLTSIRQHTEKQSQRLYCCDRTIPTDDALTVFTAYDDARAEIARLTAERDEALEGKEALSITIREWTQTYESWRDRARAAEARYNALLAERAGVSEAMVYDVCKKVLQGGPVYLRKDVDFIRAVLMAALATQISAPIDREAIRAEALEEAALAPFVPVIERAISAYEDVFDEVDNTGRRYQSQFASDAIRDLREAARVSKEAADGK